MNFVDRTLEFCSADNKNTKIAKYVYPRKLTSITHSYLSAHFIMSCLEPICIQLDFYRAMRCTSAVFAVTRCPSVCLSQTVCLSRSWITSKRITYLRNFFTIGSDTILVFPSQRGCRYSDGNPPNGGVECKEV